MEPDSWLGVEVRHLAALQALAAEHSFGRAARRLGYTQSAVSQQIATLERIVGERLVERPGGPRPVSLTEAGELLLRHAESIVARLKAAQADLHALRAGEVGTLRIGVFQSVGARVLPEIMRRFNEQWPHIDVQLHTGRSLEIVTQTESLGAYGASLARDYARWTAASAICETTDQLTEEGEPAPRHPRLDDARQRKAEDECPPHLPEHLEGVLQPGVDPHTPRGYMDRSGYDQFGRWRPCSTGRESTP